MPSRSSWAACSSWSARSRRARGRAPRPCGRRGVRRPRPGGRAATAADKRLAVVARRRPRQASPGRGDEPGGELGQAYLVRGAGLLGGGEGEHEPVGLAASPRAPSRRGGRAAPRRRPGGRRTRAAGRGRPRPARWPSAAFLGGVELEAGALEPVVGGPELVRWPRRRRPGPRAARGRRGAAERGVPPEEVPAAGDRGQVGASRDDGPGHVEVADQDRRAEQRGQGRARARRGR